MVNSFGTVSYALAAGLFGILAILLLTSWRGRLQGGLLIGASMVTVIWATLIAMQKKARPWKPPSENGRVPRAVKPSANLETLSESYTFRCIMPKRYRQRRRESGRLHRPRHRARQSDVSLRSLLRAPGSDAAAGLVASPAAS